MGYLVLSRNVGEVVVIDVPGYFEPIEVKVEGVRGRQVHLSFKAPAEIVIRREELVERDTQSKHH